MVKFGAYLRKNWAWVALLIIMVGAIFVRTYHFNDWLYFKMDQSRDSLLISNAVENGPQYLPLLGARAGAVKLKHGFLRLGPAFYYFQYASGKIFNSTEPYVFAYPDLLFSLLAIPLLYFFLILYFSKKNALLITAMYAFSFIIIQYSRFSWNPNALQFFLLASFYGLLRFLNEKESKKQKWWLALWAVGGAIGSQLHFVGFFTLIGVSGLLIAYDLQLWKKTEIKACLEKAALKKFAALAGIVVAIFLFFYTPVIISDVFKNGQNTHNFFEAMGSKAEKKPLLEKIQKGVAENARYYCLVTTGQCIDGSLKKDIPQIALTAILMLAGLWLAINGLRRETDRSKRNFLMLTLLWLGVFSVLTLPLAFQLRPRFYIVVFAVPFILIGLIFEFLAAKYGKRAFWLSLAIAALIVGLNSQGTYAWFKEQAKSQKSAVAIKRTLILKAKDGVTLGQLQGVTDWMYANHKEGQTLYYYAKPELIRPFQFLLWEKRDKNLVYKTLDINEDPKAQYFAVTPAKNGLDPVYQKYGKDISLIAQKQFGQLLVSEINFNNRTVSQTFRFNKPKTKTDRIFWEDVFGIKGDSSLVIDGDE